MEIILLTYVNRSGSTYLLSRIDNHPLVVSCPEAEVLSLLFLRTPENRIKKKERKIIASILINNLQFGCWNLNNHDIYEALKLSTCIEVFYYLLNKYRLKMNPNAEYICYKATYIKYYINRILYSASVYKLSIRFLLLVRDPRAIFSSQKNTYVKKKDTFMNKNPKKTVTQWNYLVKKGFKFFNNCKIVVIRYEDIVPFEGEKICRTIGISPVIKIADDGKKFFSKILEIEKPMHQNILMPSLSDRVLDFRNKLTPIEIAIIEEDCRFNMIRIGYSPINNRKPLKYYIFSTIYNLEIVIFSFKRILLLCVRGKYFFKNQ